MSYLSGEVDTDSDVGTDFDDSGQVGEDDSTEAAAGLDDPNVCLQEVKDLVARLDLTSYSQIRPPDVWTHEELRQCAQYEAIEVVPNVPEAVRSVVDTKVLVYSPTASSGEFDSMRQSERSKAYFARACVITGEAANSINRDRPLVCAVDVRTEKRNSSLCRFRFR